MKKIFFSILLLAATFSSFAALKYLVQVSKSVSAAGTPERMSATNNYFTAIWIQGRPTNTGNVYVQSHSTAGEPRLTLAAGQGITITVPTAGDYLNATNVFVDADVSGEIVDAIFISR